MREPFFEPDDGHLHQVGNASSAYFHVVGFWLQARSVTDGTRGLAAISAHHDPVLYLILVLLHHLEEAVDTGFLLVIAVGGQSVPQPVFLLTRQVVVGLEYGEIVVGCVSNEPLLPLAHLLSVPAHHASVVDRERCIGDDEVLVDAYDFAKSLTFRTSSSWRVEREQLVGRFFKRYSVGFEASREVVGKISGKHHEPHFAVTFIERGFGRVDETGNRVLIVGCREAVDDDVYRFVGFLLLAEPVVNAHNLVGCKHTAIAL